MVVGLDLGEHVTLAAVLVAELLQVDVLLVLVEVLATEQFQRLEQAVGSIFLLPRNETLRTL